MVECLSEIRCKEVINIVDGCRLGYAEDFEVDLCGGRLVSLLVPGPCRFFGIFGPGDDYIIPWNAIKKIGPDIVLVDVRPETCRTPRPGKGLLF